MPSMSSQIRPAALALLLLLAFAPAAPPCRLHAQAPNLKTASQLELDVIKVLLRQEAAWNRGDIDAYAEGYKNSPDTLFINNHVQRGYDSMLAEYHHNYPSKDSMGTLAFSDLEVHPLGDSFALCIGRFHLERAKKSGGNADGLFSLVFEKTPNGWRIVVDHTT
ncbi:MAG TPA: nuclear transport factor 2 family protein [Granulicella sp.]|jgi:ketosteroid isomerase-like protein|nr:nuclear transport factor 2 family protein [Granulicella sp.]